MATSAVGRELLLFRRLFVAGEEQKLGAVESDAGRSALLALLDFVRKLDVAQQLNRDAVERFRRQVAERFELGRVRTILIDIVPIAGEHLFVGMKNHEPW